MSMISHFWGLAGMLACIVGGNAVGAPQDDGLQLREQISRAEEGSTISLSKRVYHLFPDTSPKMNFYVSNHDQQRDIPVGLPIVKKKNVTLDGKGCTLMFHGKMQPVLVQDSSGVTLRNFTIRYAAPFFVEGKICEIADGKTTLEISPTMFRWKVEDGKFRILREDGEEGVGMALPFEADGPMVPMSDGGDLGWTDQAEQLSDDRVRFAKDAGQMGLKVGQILVLRNGFRPHPAMMLYRAKDTVLNKVVFSDSQGMGLLAQRSTNITINGGGCIRAKGRIYTVSADATHFSNCRGKIHVEKALYEGMMDDAINVHSTCLGIVKVESPTSIVAQYMHGQSIGFEVFLDRERVQFIRGKTLENVPELGSVKKAEMLDERHVRLTFEAPMPEGIGEGDAVENADWYPSVEFVNNTVRHNRARGALFTTPKPVLVKGNKFVRSHGSAILLAGDAQGWYESGACSDVKIIDNLFDHNLTASYQFTDAVIAICPEVRDIGKQKQRYHRNILIKDNTFRTHHVPLLSTRSAENVTFDKNKVQWDDLFQPRGNGRIFIINEPAPQKIILQNIHP